MRRAGRDVAGRRARAGRALGPVRLHDGAGIHERGLRGRHGGRPLRPLPRARGGHPPPRHPGRPRHAHAARRRLRPQLSSAPLARPRDAPERTATVVPSHVKATSWISSPSSSSPEPITPAAQADVLAEAGRGRRGVTAAAATSSRKPAIRSVRRRLAVERARARRAGSRAAASARAARTRRAGRRSRGRGRRRSRAARRTGPAGAGTRPRAAQAVARSASKMSRFAAGRRVDAHAARCFSPISSQTSPWATPGASGVAASALRLAAAQVRVRDVRRGPEGVRGTRPAPLLDAGDGDRRAFAAAPTRTVTLRIRFCFAPTSSSPS